MRTLQLSGGADTILCLYDAATMIQVACDDDGGDEPYASRLMRSFGSSGSYVMSVVHRDPSIGACDVGYQIEVTETVHTPTVTRTATRTPGTVIYLPVIMADAAPGG